ncbi:MAG: hypothetical protein IKF45_01545 [Lachnospiraceae bacterium]|nr:hypothetical protein [Lachnospiraceae bacterium]MBR2995372.1 hypothetical protein [Lachnospiraceae bacterium]
MYAIGAMQVPADFRYLDVFLKGKPQHDRDDPFRIRHPKMPCDKRAKIFSPFDALKGFSEALAAQEALKEDECAADTGLKNPRS